VPEQRHLITRAEIELTEAAIRPYIRTTPVVDVDGADFGLTSFRLTLKLEQTQHAGSFKTRGAFANLLLRQTGPAGVAAASGGNHGAAVAYAAQRLGLPARIFVPTISSPAKIARIRSYGAHLEVVGERYADALAACEAWTAESGALAVHAFDQRETLLGQATLARELESQRPELDTLLVAVGGGGLIGGIAAWYGASQEDAGGVTGSPITGTGASRAAGASAASAAGAAMRAVGVRTKHVKIVGVEPTAAPTLYEALRAGQPVDAPAGGIAADSLAPRRVGTLMFPIARDHVAEMALVEDAAIHRAQQMLWEQLRLVAEPGAAAPLAALLSGAYTPREGEHICVLISGANTTAVDFGAPPGA
jgi:threonine dehydratase